MSPLAQFSLAPDKPGGMADPIAALSEQLASRASLAAALAIGMSVVMAMVIGDVLDREKRRHHQE